MQDLIVDMRIAVLVHIIGLALNTVAEEQGAFLGIEVVDPLDSQLGILAGIADGKSTDHADHAVGSSPDLIAVWADDRRQGGELVFHIDEHVRVRHAERTEQRIGQIAAPQRAVVLVVDLPEQLFLIQIMQIGQVILEVIIAQPIVDGAVFVQVVGVTQVVLKAPGTAELVHSGGLTKSQRNLVGFAVLVGIAVAEGDQDLLELFGSGGHLEIQLSQPGLVDPLLVAGQAGVGDVDRGHRIDVAVGSGDRLADRRILLHQGAKVRSILLDQIIQDHELLAVHTVIQDIGRTNGGADKQIRKLVASEQQCLILIVALRRDLLPFHMDAGHLLILIKNEHIFPGRLVLVALAENRKGHVFGRQGEVGHCGHGQQHRDHKQPCYKFFHTETSFKYYG